MYSAAQERQNRKRNSGERDHTIPCMELNRPDSSIHYQRQAEWHDEGQSMWSPPMRHTLPSIPSCSPAAAERSGQEALRFGDGGAQVAPTHAVFQRYEALAVLAIDVRRAALEFHLRDVAQRTATGR